MATQSPAYVRCDECGMAPAINAEPPSSTGEPRNVRPVCRVCARLIADEVVHPEFLTNARIRELEAEHPDVRMGFELDGRTTRRAWRWSPRSAWPDQEGAQR
jgi:hypothetical protein